MKMSPASFRPRPQPSTSSTTTTTTTVASHAAPLVVALLLSALIAAAEANTMEFRIQAKQSSGAISAVPNHWPAGPIRFLFANAADSDLSVDVLVYHEVLAVVAPGRTETAVVAHCSSELWMDFTLSFRAGQPASTNTNTTTSATGSPTNNNSARNGPVLGLEVPIRCAGRR